MGFATQHLTSFIFMNTLCKPFQASVLPRSTFVTSLSSILCALYASLSLYDSHTLFDPTRFPRASGSSPDSLGFIPSAWPVQLLWTLRSTVSLSLPWEVITWLELDLAAISFLHVLV